MVGVFYTGAGQKLGAPVPANLHIWRAPESPHSISTSHQAPCRDVGQQVYGGDQDFHILGWCPTGRALTWHVSSPELIPQHHTNRKDSGAHLVSTLSRLGQRTGSTRSSATVGDSGPGKHKQKRFSPVGNFQLPGQEPTLRKTLSWKSHFSHTAMFKPPRPTKPSSGPHVWFYGYQVTGKKKVKTSLFTYSLGKTSSESVFC